MLFEGHSLGRRILGTQASVKKITAGQLRAFVSENFVPGNMALSIVANVDESVLEKKVLRFANKLFANSGGPTLRGLKLFLGVSQ
jgi:predicted Zn-dependent peptidase